MKLQPNQVRVTLGEASKTYTFEGVNHCSVTDENGQWLGGGINDLAHSAIYLDVIERGYSIDDHSLQHFMEQCPDLGQSLQVEIYKAGVTAQ